MEVKKLQDKNKDRKVNLKMVFKKCDKFLN